MSKILYAGSFDPITKGHMDLIEQAEILFDEIYVAVMQNPTKKNSFFSIDERVKLIEATYKDDPKIKVITGNGATIKLAEEYGCQAILRGIRGVTDFDYEIQLATINRGISHDKVNTICMFPSPTNQYTSSTVVKEIFSLGEDLSSYVTPSVEKAMSKKYPR